MISKMNPKYKIPTDELDHLVDYINDIKPFRTKLADIVCTFTFVEHAYAYASETCNSVVDFIMDYHLDPEAGYAEERFVYVDYDDNTSAKIPNVASGYEEWGFSADHFDGLVRVEDYVPSSPTTIKTSFKEQLIIDTSRTIQDGFDIEASDTDLFDSINLGTLPAVKPTPVLILPDESDPFADMFEPLVIPTPVVAAFAFNEFDSAMEPVLLTASDTLILSELFDDGEFGNIVSTYTGLIDQVAFDDGDFDRVITDVLTLNDSTFDTDFIRVLFNE